MARRIILFLIGASMTLAAKAGIDVAHVGVNGHESSIENALSEVAAFGLKLSEAKETVGDIQKIVKTWPQHFAKCGVKPREIEMLEVNLSRLV
jgi:serine/threonine-protein kinase HipA